MNAVSVSILVFCVVFSGALIGMFVRDLLPKHHLNPEAKDVVKLSMGLIGTLTALVLGLLIANASSAFQTKNTQLRQLTANIILVDALLEQYGAETRNGRQQLRRVLPAMADRIWSEDDGNIAIAPFQKSAEGEGFFRDLQALNPRTELQRQLRDRIYHVTNEVAQGRLLLHAQTGSSVRTPFLIVMVFWLFALFASFGLLGPASPLTIGALLVCAISVSGAIFLILELDRAFTGIMAISSEALRNSLQTLR